jgi:hypothetical protein
MTSKTQNAEIAETGALDDHELELVRGGFQLMPMTVQINEIAIYIGCQLPPVQKVR